MRERWDMLRALGIVVALSTALPGIGCSRTLPPDRPSFVLIISDDHDYAHMGFQGLHPQVMTPALDAIAAAGAVFPTAYVTPRCRSTLAGLLTGLPAHRSGIYANILQPRLDPALALPRQLAQAGYATFAQGKFWEGNVRDYGFSHGPGRDLDFGRAPRRDVEAFLDEVAGRPFFLWWAPKLPHRPHEPPERLRARFDPAALEVPAHVALADAAAWREEEATMLAMVAWLDERVGELVGQLEQRGRLDDTILIFLADNGWTVGGPGKGSVFEKGLRTALLFSGPGIVPAVHEEVLVSHLDVMPTVFDYAGLPPARSASGRSLRPLLEGGVLPLRGHLVGAVYPRVAANGPLQDAYALYVRTPRFKYVRYLKTLEDDDDLKILHVLSPFPGRAAGDEDLFDLKADPLEQTNLSALPEQRERLDRLREIALEWWAEAGAQSKKRK